MCSLGEETIGRLEYRRLRGAADPFVQTIDFSDSLEELLDIPAMCIYLQEISGWEFLLAAKYVALEFTSWQKTFGEVFQFLTVDIDHIKVV